MKNIKFKLSFYKHWKFWIGIIFALNLLFLVYLNPDVPFLWWWDLIIGVLGILLIIDSIFVINYRKISRK